MLAVLSLVLVSLLQTAARWVQSKNVLTASSSFSDDHFTFASMPTCRSSMPADCSVCAVFCVDVGAS